MPLVVHTNGASSPSAALANASIPAAGLVNAAAAASPLPSASAASGARKVASVTVTPSSAWVTIADTDVAPGADRINYRGARWAHVSGFHDGRLNGTSSRSDHTGDVATIHFSGQRIAVYGVEGHAGGFAKLSLDGVGIGQADFFSPSVDPKIVYMSPRLIPGQHTLSIEVTGGRAERSDGDFVNINYAKIQP